MAQEKHGGLALDGRGSVHGALARALAEAIDGRLLTRWGLKATHSGCTNHTPSLVHCGLSCTPRVCGTHRWGLEAEVDGWGYAVPRDSAVLLEAIFAREHVECARQAPHSAHCP